MPCCLTAPSRNPNQCWLLISELLWHSLESKFTASDQAAILYIEFERDALRITATSPRCGKRVNTLRPRRNEQHFADDIFKCIFLNETVWISIQISLKFVPKVPINNIPALVQIMAWRRPGDKPSSEAMMVSLLTHICVTRPQRVNSCPVPSHYLNKMVGYCQLDL